jgi:hypothetical protein
MGDWKPRWIVRVAAFAAVVAAVGMLLTPLPTNWLGAWQNQLLDFGHVPLFAAIVLASRIGMGPPLYRPAIAAIVLAGLIEVIQPFVGRTGDWMDFLRGSLGSLCGAFVIRAWESRGSWIRVVAYLTFGVVLVVWPIVEVAPYLADTVEGYQEFPVLATFSTDQEVRRWECNQATLIRAAEPGARVDFLAGMAEYPGVAMRPVACDFRGYRWLCADFQVVGTPLELAISVRTRSSNPRVTTHSDVGRRYTTGEHTVRLDLAAMAAKGDPERLDLSDVRGVIFFVIRPQETRTIVLARVWLER